MNNCPIAFRPSGGWLAAWCAYSGEIFGGLYSSAEAAHMEYATAGRMQPLAPEQFGQLAAEAVNQCKILR
jgi:hypothetical protein